MPAFIEDVRSVETAHPSPVVSPPAPAFFPGLVTAHFYASWDFYTERLGFSTVVENGAYVQLVHPCGAQLALLEYETDGAPAELVSPAEGRGFWLGIEVDDVDALHAELVAAGVPIAEPPVDKPWGERMCFVRDPNGVLITVSQRLPAR